MKILIKIVTYQLRVSLARIPGVLHQIAILQRKTCCTGKFGR